MVEFLKLGLEAVFYDTAWVRVEVDWPDRGVCPDDGDSTFACGKSCWAPITSGYSKMGCFDAPQTVIGLAVTRDGVAVRQESVWEKTVVAELANVNYDLKGWHLSLCVVVRYFGIVSGENSCSLGRAGGERIVCGGGTT